MVHEASPSYTPTSNDDLTDSYGNDDGVDDGAQRDDDDNDGANGQAAPLENDEDYDERPRPSSHWDDNFEVNKLSQNHSGGSGSGGGMDEDGVVDDEEDDFDASDVPRPKFGEANHNDDHYNDDDGYDENQRYHDNNDGYYDDNQQQDYNDYDVTNNDYYNDNDNPRPQRNDDDYYQDVAPDNEYYDNENQHQRHQQQYDDDYDQDRSQRYGGDSHYDDGNYHDGDYDEQGYYDEHGNYHYHEDEQQQQPYDNDQYYDDQYYDENDPYYQQQQQYAPPESAPDEDDIDAKIRRLEAEEEEERILDEERERQAAVAEAQRRKRHLYMALLCCVFWIVIFMIGIFFIKSNESASTPAATAATATPNVTAPTASSSMVDRTVNSDEEEDESGPTASPSLESETMDAPTPSPVATSQRIAEIRLDLIGGTDLLNDFSNATLAESCQLFLLDYVAEAVQDVECLIVDNELVERTLRQRRRNLQWLLRKRSHQPLRHRNLQRSFSALRVEIHAQADVDVAAEETVFDTAAIARLIENKRSSQDFVTILLNSQDGAFSSVTDIVLSEDMVMPNADGASVSLVASSPGPTPLLGLEPISVPSAPSPPSSTSAPTVATDSSVTAAEGGSVVLPESTVAPSADSSGGAVLLPDDTTTSTTAPATSAAAAPVTPFPTSSPTLPMDIRTKLEQTIGTDKFDALLSNPYNKALTWIEQSDPMKMTAFAPNLVQRFIAVYLYYATSMERDWVSCGPLDTSAAAAGPANCTYQMVTDMSPFAIENVPATKWLSEVGECTWVGIECDATAKIKKIELSGMNMTGSFPAGLEFLPNLKHFMLTAGELRGTIPPDVLPRMTSLANIDIQYNLFSGAFPFAGLGTTVENIYISNNNFVGSIPEDIGRLVNLNGLLVAKNTMTGTIPSAIGLLTNLEYLRLNENAFVGPLPSTISSLVLLTEIAAQENQLSGSIPSTLSTMTALTDLRLANNRLGGAIPESLYDLVGLTRLELFNNFLTGTVSTKLGQMVSLETLRIYNNTLMGTLATEVNQLTKLESAWFSLNGFTGTVPLCSIAAVAAMDVVADCLLDITTNLPEITCPCCSQCCDAAGQVCMST